MTADFVDVTPEMAEMGVLGAQVLIVDYDEITATLDLEVCVLVERPLTSRQCEHVRDMFHDAGSAAAKAVAAVIIPLLRPEEVKVDVTLGVYVQGMGG